MPGTAAAVVVFGSLNMDLIVRASRLPVPGETLTGDIFLTAGGGKGANQAVAAARMGAMTRLVGRVGDDAFGDQLRANLAASGVELSGVEQSTGVSTGVALITVEDSGQNTIVIIPGANGEVAASDITRLRERLSGASCLLLQLESPLEIVLEAARAAHEAGVRCILDPAPAQPLPPELYTLTDILTPNETETALLTGIEVIDLESAAAAARRLADLGARQIIIKLGSRGVYAYESHNGQGTFYPAFVVQTVDTVAAGDTFNGALAALLSEGAALATAIQYGQAAAALSTMRPGAQPSMPDRAAVEVFIHKKS